MNAPRRLDPRDSEAVLALFHSQIDRVEPIARALYRRMPVGVVALEDLCASGREGLLLAARSFGASASSDFGVWARMQIRSAIVDAIRRFGMSRRTWSRHRKRTSEHVACAYRSEEWALAMGAGGDSCGGAPGCPDELVERAQVARRLRQAVERLPTAERQLVEHLYWSDQSLAETASSMGLSASWARRLRSRALGRLSDQAMAGA
jgi:RNA polymerase sigma factor (sigma-70 family)